MNRGPDAPIERLEVSCYTVPTDRPESDGTLEWDSTTCAVVEVHGAGARGLGYTYGPRAAATLIAEELAGVVEGRDAMDVERAWWAMAGALRNAGRPGIGSMAISAVDVALWDLKAKLLGLPLVALLGRVRDAVPVYGSGGFTSYSMEELAAQLIGWVEEGIHAVKMKVGREPDEDVPRVRHAREAIGDAELMVDANGAYDRTLALEKGRSFASLGVTWFEEPVSSDDLEGLRLLRDSVPAPVEIAAGEYASDHFDLQRLAGAVDALQADATRCGGITGFLRAGVICEANGGLPLSAHTAPTLHAHGGAALHPLRHVEYFHDHVRVEALLFDGALQPRGGALRPDPGRPGLGLELKRIDAERYAA